jgi:glycosyltransferase involved in cell wall biosynthesis
LTKLGLSTSSLPLRAFCWLRNKILKKADGFVAISFEIAKELANCGIRASAIEMIPNSVDAAKFCPVPDQKKHELRNKLRIPQKDKIVTFTGRLVSYKGLPLLLRVWNEIQRQQNSAKLLLVGSGGLDIHNCEKELKKYVKENGLENSVHFTGNVNNVHQYLQASDLFVFPTENEAFGISLVEAMACGLPVISTSVGGVKDIVKHNENALVVNAGDFQELYDALDLLMTDTTLSAGLGKTARHTIHERYSDHTVIKRYITLFNKIASSSPKVAPLAI